MTVPARPRIPLRDACAPFKPTARAGRISLAWWDAAEREGAREPVLVPSDHGYARTLIAVWPTDVRGRLMSRAVRQGAVTITPWDLRPVDIDRLRILALTWPLDLHDLQVTDRWIRPCAESLRTMELGIDLDRRVRQGLSWYGLID